MRLKTGIYSLLVVLSLAICPFTSAYADGGSSITPDVDADKSGLGFLSEISAKANMPATDFVATLAGTNSIYTGVNWVNTDGSIALKNQLSQNLVSFKRNVIYGKSWDEMTSTEHESYVNEDDYLAHNFNSSLDAYGLGDARDRFYSSGGGSFTWTSEEESVLDKISGVYNDWNTGKDVLIGDVLDLFEDDAMEKFSEYLGVSNDVTIDGSKVEGWPAGAPSNVSVSLVNGIRFTGLSGSTHNYRNWAFSNAVYSMIFVRDNSSAVGYSVYSFSKDNFLYGYNTKADELPTPGSNASVENEGLERQFYRFNSQSTIGGSIQNFTSNVPYNLVSEYPSTSVRKQIAELILFGSDISIGGYKPDIEDYPQDIQASASVGAYYPSDGIQEDTTWTNYLEAIEQDTDDMVELLKRILTQVRLLDTTSEDLTDLENALDRFTFYSNGILKVHDEGVFDSLTDIGSDIHDILLTLTAWPKGDSVDAPDLIGDFNFPQLKTKAGNLTETISELAPFGGILLLSEMVGVLSQTGNISKPEFRVPFKFYPAHDFEVVIDLSWLDDGKVYVNFFCILSLIICLVNVTIRVIELEAAG